MRCGSWPGSLHAVCNIGGFYGFAHRRWEHPACAVWVDRIEIPGRQLPRTHAALARGCFLPCSCKHLWPSFAKLLLSAVVGGGGEHAVALWYPGAARFLHCLDKILLAPCCAASRCGFSLCICEWGKGLCSQQEKWFICSSEGGGCCVKSVYRPGEQQEGWRQVLCAACGTARGFRPCAGNGTARGKKTWQGNTAREPQKQRHLSPSVIQRPREDLMKEPSKPGQEKGSFPFQLPQWSNANELEGLTLGNKRTKLLKKLNNFRCKTEKKTTLLVFGRGQTGCHHYPDSLS